MKKELLTLIGLIFLFSTPLFAIEVADPAEVSLGERLFKESRFAQYFFASKNQVNTPLTVSDSSVENLILPDGARLLNPAMKGSISCASCHMVDQGLSLGGMRTYSDFSVKSSIPFRSEDSERSLTLRNSPAMVDILPTQSTFLHYDGEFITPEDLTIGGLTGRNFGWLKYEYTLSVKHIAKVIREDNGTANNAQDFGGISYKKILKSTAEDVPKELRLPVQYRLDVTTASDQQVLRSVAKLITAYMQSLQFSKDEDGNYNGSPYDKFLEKNLLPRKPKNGESEVAYTERLALLLNENRDWNFIDNRDGNFKNHQKKFSFSEQELKGARLFFSRSAGNCASCHTAPTFSDFAFHNTGIAQEEYDTTHGRNSFWNLYIPTLGKRDFTSEQFASLVDRNRPGRTDLGLWNTWKNPSLAKPQIAIEKTLCPKSSCTPDSIAEKAIARFKTSGLRDLADSAPYFHTGKISTMEESVLFYVRSASLARKNLLRNADSELTKIHLRQSDVKPLTDFLLSLTEDYE